MNQRYAKRQCYIGKDARGHSANGKGCFRLAFGHIDRFMDRCVDDQIGANVLYLLASLIELHQIKLIAPRHEQLADKAQSMLQLT